MNQNEFWNDADGCDAELSTALKSLPSIAAPADLQQQIRRRIHAKTIQRQMVVGLRAAVLLLLLALIVRVWGNSVVQIAPQGELSAAELNFLFAPPPVDPLTVLDQQQHIAYRTLQRWESNR